jgi:hypothetical protein
MDFCKIRVARAGLVASTTYSMQLKHKTQYLASFKKWRTFKFVLTYREDLALMLHVDGAGYPPSILEIYEEIK